MCMFRAWKDVAALGFCDFIRLICGRTREADGTSLVLDGTLPHSDSANFGKHRWFDSVWLPRRFRIEGIEDGAGSGCVPVSVPGFLFMDIKFGRYVDANAPQQLVNAELLANRTTEGSGAGHGVLGGPNGVDGYSEKSADGRTYAYDLYAHVFQAANVVCSSQCRAPHSFIEVDLNGQFAKNLHAVTDQKLANERLNSSVSDGCKSSNSNDSEATGRDDERLFRTTIRRGEVCWVLLCATLAVNI